MSNADELGYALLFPSGTKIWGADAYDTLEQMRGGWNPDTRDELKIALCRRAGIWDKEVLFNILLLSDDEFIRMLFERNFWVVKRVPLDLVAKHAYRTADAI